jgi:hypothetical protein
MSDRSQSSASAYKNMESILRIDLEHRAQSSNRRYWQIVFADEVFATGGGSSPIIQIIVIIPAIHYDQ